MRTIDAFQMMVLSKGAIDTIHYDEFQVWWASTGLPQLMKTKAKFDRELTKSFAYHRVPAKTDGSGNFVIDYESEGYDRSTYPEEYGESSDVITRADQIGGDTWLNRILAPLVMAFMDAMYNGGFVKQYTREWFREYTREKFIDGVSNFIESQYTPRGRRQTSGRIFNPLGTIGWVVTVMVGTAITAAMARRAARRNSPNVDHNRYRRYEDYKTQYVSDRYQHIDLDRSAEQQRIWDLYVLLQTFRDSGLQDVTDDQIEDMQNELDRNLHEIIGGGGIGGGKWI